MPAKGYINNLGMWVVVGNVGGTGGMRARVPTLHHLPTFPCIGNGRPSAATVQTIQFSGIMTEQISLINYFAGQALQGFLAHSGTGYNERGELVALLPEEAAFLAMKCARALWRLTDEYEAEEKARAREDERVAALHATYPHLNRRGRPGP